MLDKQLLSPANSVSCLVQVLFLLQNVTDQNLLLIDIASVLFPQLSFIRSKKDQY